MSASFVLGQRPSSAVGSHSAPSVSSHPIRRFCRPIVAAQASPAFSEYNKASRIHGQNTTPTGVGDESRLLQR